MANDNLTSVMRRKAGAGRAPPEIPPASVTSILRAVLVQAAEEVAGLIVCATEIGEQRTVIGALEDQLPQHSLLALVEGPNSQFGLIAADPDLTAALIEMQTTGRVVPNQATARAPTRTDAVMCADFFDRVLEQFEQGAQDAGLVVAPLVMGYRYAVALDDFRAVAMTLDDVPYRVFSAKLDLGNGAKTGMFTLLMPFAPPDPRKVSSSEDGAKANDATPQVLLQTQTQLHAVLHRTQLSLDDVLQLSVGTTLTIPRDAVGAVTLEDMSGDPLMSCRLGQAQGNRALRLGEADDGQAQLSSELETVQMPLSDPRRTSTTPLLNDTMGDLDALNDPNKQAVGELPGLAPSTDLADMPDLADLSALSADMPA